MKRIAVTQRVETFYGGKERRDCLDQAWTTLLQSFGAIPLPLPNALSDPGRYLSMLGVEGVILSGGNDLAELADPEQEGTASERDATERAIVSHCIGHRVPLLGVCRGMQAINIFLGGRGTRISRHAGTRHSVQAQAGFACYWPGQFEVNSYHHFGILPDGLAPHLDAAVTCAADGTVEAFCHQSANCVGVMWHPEREPAIAHHDGELVRRLLAA